MTAYTPADVAAWHHPSTGRAEVSEQQKRLARLQPLDPPPAPNASAAEVIRRLTESYPHRPFAALPAAESMSDAGKPRDIPSLFTATSLRKSSLLLGRFEPTADEVGTATHLVLQHLDFRRPCDVADVAEQLRELVDRRLLRPEMEKQVDAAAVCWLMSTPLGALLREHAVVVRRELPLYAAAAPAPTVAPDSADPLDRVMLRGRIDALIPLPAESVLVDYKTDAVAKSEVPARAELYRPQLARYADAMRQVTGNPVRVYLAFLGPRVIFEAPR